MSGTRDGGERRAPDERPEDRTLRTRLRRVRQQRRWQLPLEEDLTPIYIQDTGDANVAGGDGATDDARQRPPSY